MATDVYALRVNFIGELGWELHFPIEYANGLFDALFAAGREFGIGMVGMRAMESLRIEKSYRMWGSDLTPDYTPFEAGLDRFVRMEKGEFIGKAALARQLAAGVPHRFVTLEVHGVTDADPLGNEPLFVGGTLVGRATAGAYGHVRRQEPRARLRRARARRSRRDDGDRDPRRAQEGHRARRIAARSGEPAAAQLSRTAKVLVFALAGWSGFFVMAVELLSGRILAPTFGNSIYVWGAVITVFMLALAVGYLLGGRYSVHSPSLRRLGALLIAAGLATLPVVLFGNAALDAIFDRVNDPRYGSLIASALLFFVPTAISGAVSPYAVRLAGLQPRMPADKSAGSLYFVSTFGSAAGTLVTSFYLVLLFEVNAILMGLMAVSIVLGLIAVLFREAGALRVAPAWVLAGLACDRRDARHSPTSCTPSDRSTATSSSYEDDGIRCMKFGRQAAGRQTCQSLADPDRLVFDYTRMMMAALYLNPSPQRILIIGLGGGTLPRTLQKILPDRADRRGRGRSRPWCGSRASTSSSCPARRPHVFEEDGRVFAKRMGKQRLRYDLVMLDAFDHEYIPEHLLTREFLLEIKGLLAAARSARREHLRIEPPV